MQIEDDMMFFKIIFSDDEDKEKILAHLESCFHHYERYRNEQDNHLFIHKKHHRLLKDMMVKLIKSQLSLF